MSGMNKDDVIVVTGGGGFIGAHLVAELLDAGFQQIRSVDVKPIEGWFQVFPDVDNQQLDLRSKDACYQALDIGRFVNHRRALYTPEWTKMDVALYYPLAEEDIPRPKLLPRMIEVAEILSADFDYVRIDLYEVDGRIFFGEATFMPDAGYGKFTPISYDRIWGDRWKIAFSDQPGTSL